MTSRSDVEVDAPAGEPFAWEPAWCVHPGEVLSEELDERGWRQTDLVDLTGFTAKHINQVIKGKAHIGPAFAIALGDAFGTSAQLWMNLQTMWDIAEERARQHAIGAAGARRLTSDVEADKN